MKMLGILAGCVLALFVLEAQSQMKTARPASEIPMYGDPDKPNKLSKSDAAFIASIEKAGHTRQEVAKDAAYEGWVAFQKGNRKLAIRKFNQGWLLDQDNPSAYHGFAVIVWMRDNAFSEAEKFFGVALSKPDVAVEARVDFGRFLLSQKRYDESITVLKKALEISPDARGASSNISLNYSRKQDYAQACEWAKSAAEKKEALPGGHLRDMCMQAGQSIKLSSRN